MWRFDLDEAGAGIGGDLGSHWAYLARWHFGEIAAVTAISGGRSSAGRGRTARPTMPPRTQR
jgi:predicted dehydrogenase